MHDEPESAPLPAGSRAAILAAMGVFRSRPFRYTRHDDGYRLWFAVPVFLYWERDGGGGWALMD